MMAVNDSLWLISSAYILLTAKFRHHPCYVKQIELFHLVCIVCMCVRKCTFVLVCLCASVHVCVYVCVYVCQILHTYFKLQVTIKIG